MQHAAHATPSHWLGGKVWCRPDNEAIQTTILLRIDRENGITCLYCCRIGKQMVAHKNIQKRSHASVLLWVNNCPNKPLIITIEDFFCLHAFLSRSFWQQFLLVQRRSGAGVLKCIILTGANALPRGDVKRRSFQYCVCNAYLFHTRHVFQKSNVIKNLNWCLF